jgi:beta-lactamase superfamily II metal-dependent hydrolase
MSTGSKRAYVMQRALVLVAAVLSLISSEKSNSQTQKPLTIYYLDMEGGGGTLMVSPSGESLLVDSGNPGLRDAARVVAAAREAGLKQIDYFVPTHYHADHYGGVTEVVKRIPIRSFVDIGPNPDRLNDATQALFRAYSDARDRGRHIVVRPGDRIPISGIEVTVVTAGGETLKSALLGAGGVNPLCNGDGPPRGSFNPGLTDLSGRPVMTEQATALGDGASIGLHIRLRNFRAAQFGDLTWNKEHELVCPNNVVGTVDVFQPSAHGMNFSSPKSLVHALRPRVIVVNNGPMKGGSRETMATIKTSPGLEDVWLVHYAVPRPGNRSFMEFDDQGGKEVNPLEQFIANVEDAVVVPFVPRHKDDAAARNTFTSGDMIRLTAREDGTFFVTNSRTGYTKEYGRP